MTPLANMRLMGCIEYLSILDMSIKNTVGEHGELRFKLLMEYENSANIEERIKGTTVQLVDEEETQIFSGICTEATVFEMAEYRELDIVVMTHTKLADIDSNTYTYQSTSKTLCGVMQENLQTYGGTIAIDEDVLIPFSLLQKEETDWQFLKRIAAQHGKEIFVDVRADIMSIYIGEPEVENLVVDCKVLGNHKDVHSMRMDMAVLGITPSMVEYEVLDVETDELTIVPGNIVNGYRVVENYIYSDKGMLLNRLALQYVGTVRTNSMESHDIALENCILTGTVDKVVGNYIQVSFTSDKGTGGKPWIPYESAISNSFYCMPDEKDEVYIYYDNAGKAVCLGSKRTNLEDENFQTPEDDSMSFMGKMIKLGTDKVLLISEAKQEITKVASITINENEGIDIYSDEGINIDAKEKVQFLAVQGMEPSSLETAIEKYEKSDNLGSQKYEKDGGRGFVDKIGLSLASWGAYASNKVKNGVKSEFYVDVFEKMAASMSDGVKQVGNAENPDAIETYIEIEALGSIILKSGNDSYIQLDSMLQIQTPHFEWLGTEKQTYQEVSVADTDIFDTILDGVQLVLDIAGMIPLFGFVPDLINAGISLLRGDFVGAGLSLISAIPGLGDAVGAGKIVGKTAKIITKAAKVLDKVNDFKKSHMVLTFTINFIKFGAAITLGGLRMGYAFEEIDKREGTSDEQDTADKWIAVLNYLTGIAGAGVEGYKDLAGSSGSTAKPNGTTNRPKGGNEGTQGAIIGTDGKVTTDIPIVTNKPEATKPESINARVTEHKGDPVNMVTGSLTIAHTDMNYNDIAGSFSLVRTYESVYTNENHLLGNRWIYNLESKLHLSNEKITIRMPDNHLEQFIRQNGSWQNEREGDAVYALSENGDGYALYSKRDKKTYYYNEAGLLDTISDRNGNSTHFSYIGTQLVKMVLASGVTLSFSYDGKKLKTITDNIEREISYEYDGELLTKVHYPNGATVQYEYDHNGNIVSIWDENGQKYITNQYDRKGRVLKQIMADGEEYVYFYDDANRVNTILTMSTGNSMKYEYNRKDLVTGIVYQDQTREEKEYDASDNLIRYKDRMGYITSFTYDANGNLLQKVLPNGLTLTCTYDENDYLIYSADNAGRENWFTYDKKGNLLSQQIKIAEDVVVENRYEYDDAGRMVAYVDGNGNRTAYIYDANFVEPTSIIMADGTQKTYTYDTVGRRMSENNGKAVLQYAYNQFDYVTSIIDEEGNITKFVYDLACNLTKIIRPKEYHENALQGAGIEYKYDSMQHLVGIVNPCGDISAVQVNSAGAAVKEIHPNAYAQNGEAGAGIENVYDVFGNRTHIKYPEGGTRRMLYNALGQCIKDIGPAEYQEETDDGVGYEYEYNSVGRIIQITDPNGKVIKRYVYNLMGAIEKEIDAKGMDTGSTDEERIGTLYHYNLCGWLMEIRQPVSYENGQAGYCVTTYEYDKIGNVITEKRYLDVQSLYSQSGRVNIVHRKYDACGRLVRVSDNMGAELIYRYDMNGNLIYESRKINDEHQQIRSWSYNKRGKVEQFLQTADFKATKQKAARITFAYDENANLIRKTLPDGSEITYCYDAAGRIIEETHREKKGGICNTICYEYDHAGNTVVIRDSSGMTVQQKFDFMNRLVMETGTNGATTQYCYGKNGRLEKIITPKDYAAGEAAGIRYIYDNCGRMTAITGRMDELLFCQEYNAYGEVCSQQHAGLKPVTYRYDFAGRRVESITGEQRTESIGYDAMGNICFVTDGNANTTAYEYDTWGRITAIKRVDGSAEHYAYDYAGNIILSVDGNGNEVHYAYNEINKLSRIIWQDATKEEYAYDISGNLSRQTLRDGRSISYTYNMYQSLTTRRSGDGSIEEHYLYEADGRLRSAIAGGMRYDYKYNPDGSLREKSASGRMLISYEYDLNGNITKQTDVSGKTISYEYDGYDRLSRVYDTVRLLAEYDYTAFGRKKSIRLPGITETHYEYDGDAELTVHRVQTVGGLLADTRYEYDRNGNMVHKTGIYGEYRYTYDSLNRLVSESFTGTNSRGIAPEDYTIRYAYDKAGNRISMEKDGIRHQYTYDGCNRLITEQTGSVQKQFTYDICGNLLTDGSQTYSYDELNRLTTITTADGHVQKNRYDAEDLRHELEEDGRLVQFIYNRNREVIAEESGEAGLIRYIRGLGLISSDSEGAKTYYHYVSDHLGSISHVLNEKAETENEYVYDAFGNMVGSSENVENRFGYSGEQYDQLANQYYLRARYYNPVIGRFTQQDTYLGAGLNLYAYCNNNPLSYVDPSGHEPKPPAGVVAENKQLPMVVPQPGDLLPVLYKPTGSNTPISTVQNSSQSTALMVVPQPGDLLPVLYKPTGSNTPISTVQNSSQSTALMVIPQPGSQVPAVWNNPLVVTQYADVSNAVRDAGGASESGSKTVKDGATRAARFSSGWGDASLREAINKFAPNANPIVRPKGKITYDNPQTGISVVYDINGNYFRIEDTTRPRGRNYLDMNGNDMNNEIVNGKTRGRSRADYQRVTHFNNSDE